MADIEETQPAPSAEKLPELITAANLQYSLKNYSSAVELYSRATELQGQINGEMAPENAELLYLYGRCLYHVAVEKSDVLGAKVVGEEKAAKKKKAENAGATGGEGSSKNTALAASNAKQEETVENKPYFQITGDENWTDSEEEEGDDDDEEGAEGGAEEDDDFANAYEILDLARLLLSKQLEAAESQEQPAEANAEGAEADKGKGKSTDDSTTNGATKEIPPAIRQLKERLADTYDLQAEISLENERFEDAIPDARASLELKEQLFPPESNLIAEAHYKLSLALEYASMTAVREAEQEQQVRQTLTGKEAVPPPQVDMALREEAAKEMEAALASLKLRVKKEESGLESQTGSQLEASKASVKDAKEMMDDMRQRLHDLRVSPVESNTLENSGIGAPSTSKASSGAVNDLTGFVKHKKKPETETEAENKTTAKRKHEDEEDGNESSTSNKKAKPEA